MRSGFSKLSNYTPQKKANLSNTNATNKRFFEIDEINSQSFYKEGICYYSNLKSVIRFFFILLYGEKIGPLYYKLFTLHERERQLKLLKEGHIIEKNLPNVTQEAEKIIAEKRIKMKNLIAELAKDVNSHFSTPFNFIKANKNYFKQILKNLKEKAANLNDDNSLNTEQFIHLAKEIIDEAIEKIIIPLTNVKIPKSANWFRKHPKITIAIASICLFLLVSGIIALCLFNPLNMGFFAVAATAIKLPAIIAFVSSVLSIKSAVLINLIASFSCGLAAGLAVPLLSGAGLLLSKGIKFLASTFSPAEQPTIAAPSNSLDRAPESGSTRQIQTVLVENPNAPRGDSAENGDPNLQPELKTEVQVPVDNELNAAKEPVIENMAQQGDYAPAVSVSAVPSM